MLFCIELFEKPNFICNFVTSVSLFHLHLRDFFIYVLKMLVIYYNPSFLNFILFLWHGQLTFWQNK